LTGFTSIIAGSTSRPVRELRGFQRTLLAPGEKKTLRLTVGKDELSFWSPDVKVWVEESEAFDVWIGGGLYGVLARQLSESQATNAGPFDPGRAKSFVAFSISTVSFCQAWADMTRPLLR